MADASMHPVFSQNPLVLTGAVGAYSGEPRLDNGYVIGAVSIFDSKAREFTETEPAVLRPQARSASAFLAVPRQMPSSAWTW